MSGISGRLLALSFAALIAAQTAPASAAVPIDGWKIEPSNARCVAVRHYGDPARPTTLALKASAVDEAVQLAVIRYGFRSKILQSEATLEIDGRKIETSSLSYPLAAKPQRVTHLISVDPEPAATLRSAKILKLEVKEGVSDSFPLEPSAALWKDLQDCVGRVRDMWNIGEDNAKRIATSAQGDLQGLFRPEDYPLVSAKSDQQGTTTFIILMDEKGTAKDCTIIGSSGSASLDSRSCGIILERGKFSPAMDAEGKPMESAFVRRITWRLF